MSRYLLEQVPPATEYVLRGWRKGEDPRGGAIYSDGEIKHFQ